MYEHPALLKAENYFGICCDNIHRCLILQIICDYPHFNNSPGDYLQSTWVHHLGIHNPIPIWEIGRYIVYYILPDDIQVFRNYIGTKLLHTTKISPKITF